MSDDLMDINLDPVIQEETGGRGARVSNLDQNFDVPLIKSSNGRRVPDPGGASFGSFQLNERNVKDFVDNSPWADEFKGVDLKTRSGRKLFDEKWKRLADTDPQFVEAQKRAALELPNTKQALRFAQQLAGDTELTPNLKGYAAGVGINMGDASAQWHILQPLKMYAEGSLTESEALKQMAMRRTQVNKRFEKEGLIPRNMKEPILFDPSIDKKELQQSIKKVASENRSKDDLMLEMIAGMPANLRNQYLQTGSKEDKVYRQKAWKQYAKRQEQMREAQLRRVYSDVERFIKRGM